MRRAIEGVFAQFKIEAQMVGVFVGVFGAYVGIEAPGECVVVEDWIVKQGGHLVGELDVYIAIGLKGEVKREVAHVGVDVTRPIAKEFFWGGPLGGNGWGDLLLGAIFYMAG